MARGDNVVAQAQFEIAFESDPRLVLGWRPGPRRLDAERVPLRDDVFDTLRRIPQETLHRLASSRARPYEPAAELEEGEEHFVITIADLPEPKRPRGRPRREETQESGNAAAPSPVDSDTETALPNVADLINITRRVDDLDSLDAGRLAEGSFLFYGIVLPGNEGNVAFIKRTDPVTTLRKGRAFFQFSDALVSAGRPDFMLFSDVDLVVGPSAIVAFRKNALDTLLSDVRVVLQDVPVNVRQVSVSLPAEVPLSDAAREALEQYCSTRPSLAARLRTLPGRIRQIRLTPELIRDALRRHGEVESLLLNNKGQFEFSEGGVRAFLDIAEGRWFEDEFTGERRRADRYSIRKSVEAATRSVS